MSVNKGPHSAHNSWGIWEGCDKVAPECAHCYIHRLMRRKKRQPWGKHYDNEGGIWDAPFAWQKKAARDGVCERVFVCPLGDFFHAKADKVRDRAWEVIRQCPNQVFLLITKRPSRIMSHLPPGWPDEFPNVWLGTTAGSKRSLVKMDTLRAIPIHPKAVRMVVMEPLLEDVADEVNFEGFGWVLVGGESGAGEEYRWDPNGDWKAELQKTAGRRTMKLEWVRRIKAKVEAAGASFFFKQVTSACSAAGVNALDGQLWRAVPPPPLPLPWRERPAIEDRHLYSIQQLASLDEDGHPTVGRGPEPGGDEPKLDNLSNLQAELAVIEGEITGRDGRALTKGERVKLERRRDAVIACFKSSRYERGRLLSEYRESFRKSNRIWMKAAKAIADAEGVNPRTIRRYISDYKAAASIPATVRAALNDKGVDAAKKKNRVLVERLVNLVKSEPTEPDKEQASQIVADEMMKIPVAPDLSDVSEPLDADEKLRHLIRKGIRQAVANIQRSKRLEVVKAALEEEMYMNWGQKEPVTITLTPHWTPITFDGRKLKSDDRTQEVAA